MMQTIPKNTGRKIITKLGATRIEVLRHINTYQLLMGLPVQWVALVDDRGKIEYMNPEKWITEGKK